MKKIPGTFFSWLYKRFGLSATVVKILTIFILCGLLLPLGVTILNLLQT